MHLYFDEGHNIIHSWCGRKYILSYLILSYFNYAKLHSLRLIWFTYLRYKLSVVGSTEHIALLHIRVKHRKITFMITDNSMKR